MRRRHSARASLDTVGYLGGFYGSSDSNSAEIDDSMRRHGDSVPADGGGGWGDGRRIGPPSGAQFAGYGEAQAALNKPGCAGAVAGAGGIDADALATLLWNAGVSTGTDHGLGEVSWELLPDGNYKYKYKLTYTEGGNIQLNANYFPDPTVKNVKLPDGKTSSLLDLVNGALESSLDGTQLGAFVFLHELAHIANAGDIDNNKFNASIIENCIK